MVAAGNARRIILDCGRLESRPYMQERRPEPAG